jgi:hypothetical protein
MKNEELKIKNGTNLELFIFTNEEVGMTNMVTNFEP